MRLKQTLRGAVCAAALVTGAALAVGSAQANIILIGTADASGQGFGSISPLLTLQNTGTESGVVNVGAGGVITGGLGTGVVDTNLVSDPAFKGTGNKITNTGGNEVNPFTDTVKFGIPTLASLNYTSGSDVRLLFNGNEPAGNSLTITDITLKFYSGTTLLLALDNDAPIIFPNSFQGQGSAGYILGLDATQAGLANSFVFNQAGFGNFRIALEATITGAAGGAESFSALSRPVPGPIAGAGLPAILAFGGAAAWFRRRKQKVA